MLKTALRPPSPASALLLAALTAAFAGAGCSSSSSSSATTKDSGAPTDANTVVDSAAATDTGAGADASGLTTIAAAITGKVTSAITFQAVVIGLHGQPPSDITQWYVEDPNGGPNSGIAVYCDPALSSCPTIKAPALGALVQLSGKITTYKGTLQFIPTAQTVVKASTTLPPVATVTSADIAPTANSPYRGVLAKYATKITVDSVTPMALYDTQCATATTPDAGSEAGAADAGPTQCTGCTPPTYSGFQAHDGSNNEVYIEDFFFAYDHFQSSPECANAAGNTPVTVGETFSSLTGILDYDGYASAQAFYPLSDADVVTP